jgi:exopolysaccharide biosynthesis polyprenyl glycosylphosphotransferase
MRRTRAISPAALTEGASSTDLLVREGRSRRTLAAADALAGGAALTLIIGVGADAGIGLWILVAMAAIVFVNKLGGLYERDEVVLRKSTLDEAPALIQISGLFALIAWLGHYRILPGTNLGPNEILQLWAGTLVALLGGRMTARALVRRVAEPERCIVIGSRDSIATVRRKLASASVHAQVVAALPLDDERTEVDPDTFRLTAWEHRAHRAIIAPVGCDGADTLDVVRIAKGAGLRVSLLPRLCEVVGSSVEFDDVEGLTMLGVRRFGLTRSSILLKRAFDLAGATLMLVAVAPVMAAAALAVRLDSRGPVFFRQTRVGRDGKHFGIYKFRSMGVDAEALKADLRHLNETEGLFKIAEDPRVTRIGRLLRRTSLDELPQLFNVWRGEMSLVGPRPLVVDEDAKVEGLDRARLHLTPGMTGHWQILGSARIPLDEMVGIDYLYVANWTLWTDLKILLRTLPYVVSRSGM